MDNRARPRTPFVDGILDVPLPIGWEPLSLERYDGTTDPDEHINTYVTQVHLYTTDDALMCKIFPTSLKGLALQWWTSLPQRSIPDFNTLVKRFTSRYVLNRPFPTTSIALINLRQDDDEPLRTFMERFSQVTVKIHDLEPAVAVFSLVAALKPGPFMDSLCKREPTTMEELRTRAIAFIQMEEASILREKAANKEKRIEPTTSPTPLLRLTT